MDREQEIIKQMLDLAEEFSKLSYEGHNCSLNTCWARGKLCDAIGEFISSAKERLKDTKDTEITLTIT